MRQRNCSALESSKTLFWFREFFFPLVWGLALAGELIKDVFELVPTGFGYQDRVPVVTLDFGYCHVSTLIEYKLRDFYIKYFDVMLFVTSWKNLLDQWFRGTNED